MALDKKEIIQSIKAVVLDMDGVLVDTEPIHMESFRLFMEELNISSSKEERHSFIGYSIAQNIKTINQKYLKGREINIDEGVRHRDEIYIKLLKEIKPPPIRGIIDLINHCYNNGIKLALASSSSREQIDIILTNLSDNPNIKVSPYDFFRSIVSGDDVARTKPAPDIYKKALNDLGLPGGRCLAIEDSTAGIRSSKSAGLFCFALKNDFADDKKLSEADALIDSISDVVDLLYQLTEVME